VISCVEPGCRFRDDQEPVGGGEHGQQRGQAEHRRGRTIGHPDLDDVEAA
jgi:hypothetical protein